MHTIALTALLLASTPPAQPPTPAETVIAKAITAMGGLERIHALHSIVYTGFHYEGSYKQEYAGSRTSNATLTRMRPNRRLVGCRPEIPSCKGQWGRIIETFDGQHGWELNWPKQRLVSTVNKADRAIRCGAEFDYLFIAYKQRGFTAKYLGPTIILNTKTEALEVDQPNCPAITYYFQPGTYTLLMTGLTIPLHARGDAVSTVSVVREFKTINGVRLPSRSEEVNLATGEVIGGGNWTSIEANTITNPAIFTAPEVHPTGITAVTLHMLHDADTATPDAIMATYIAFRSSPEGHDADVVYDMNWLAYELLKVDKYAHAIAIFQRLIDENPTSAAAYENLGETYLQQHDDPNAIAAFQHALALGLKSDDVLKKLGTLCAPQSCEVVRNDM